MSYSVAVVGATGTVGSQMLEILASRQFPYDQVYALASARSKGESVDFGEESLIVEDIAEFDFSTVAIALFSAGTQVAKQYAPLAAEKGCVVIDNSSCFRYDEDIPLVVPEVNANVLEGFPQGGIIANPNCSTIQMLVALAPLHAVSPITRINVATYQSVSGTGQSGIEELAMQTAQTLNGQPIECSVYPKQIAFNVLPHIDSFQENGYTREEMKMVWETQKILDPSIQVNPTCVRTPVFYGHAEALHIETQDKISLSQAAEVLKSAPGVILVEGESYPTPMSDAVHHDAVFVGRLREDISCDHGLNLWVVADNTRKGAALNAVQIAEIIVKNR